jgi:hypothetical protein
MLLNQLVLRVLQPVLQLQLLLSWLLKKQRAIEPKTGQRAHQSAYVNGKMNLPRA